MCYFIKNVFYRAGRLFSVQAYKAGSMYSRIR